jgi:transcriptional regulator with XRE-family HTH domain
MGAGSCASIAPMSTDESTRDSTRAKPLPREITGNQVVAWNVAWLRREAGMTQLELAARLGWPQNRVSEAERSWNGKRTREFDAHTIIALALALGVTVNALFLPPLDDGQDCAYLIRPPGYDDDLSMGELLAITITDMDEDTEIMASYRRRLLDAVGRYLGDGWRDEVAGWLRRVTGVEALREGVTRLRGLHASLLASASDVGEWADALDRAAEEEPG